MNQYQFRPGNRPVQKRRVPDNNIQPTNYNGYQHQDDGDVVHQLPGVNSLHGHNSYPPSYPSVATNRYKPAQQNLPSSNSLSTTNSMSLGNRLFNDNQPTSTGVRQIRAHGYKVHGGKAALEVKPDEKLKTRDNDLVDENGERNIFHTIRLEAASSNKSGDRTYNWKDKITIQLTDIELPLFIGVCMGFLTKFQFGNHGIGSEKSSKYFSVEQQGRSVFFQIGQKDKVNKSVPVNLPQATHIAMMSLEVYARNFPGLDSNTISNSIANMCRTYQSIGITEIKDRA